MDNNNDNKENKEKKDTKETNHKNVNNGFVKSSPSNYKKTVSVENKDHFFLRSILVPFLVGILGASLILALFVYVPVLRKNFSSSSNSEKSLGEKIFTSSGPVNTGVSISEYSDTAISVANKVLPSVVGIQVNFSISSNSFLGTQSEDSYATGSGVIISSDGYIITNNHVIDTSSSSTNYYSVSEANSIKVYLYNEEEPVDAEIIGSDSVTDLAVLKVDRNDLTAIEFGDSDSVQIGEFAMAIGSPLDMRNTVTAGIVSGLNREIEDTGGTMYTLIQTDAAINAGNSGGALVNAEGKLIGINTLKMYGTGIEGMGFAIPVNSTFDITEQLISSGKVKRPYIGFSGRDLTEYEAEYYRLPVGIYVERIESDGPAKKSDLEKGDIVIKFNGNEVKTMSQLNKYKNQCKIGDTITLTVSRNNEEVEIPIVLAEQP